MGQPEREWHLTLTDNRPIQFLLTNRYVQPAVHVVTVSIFAWAIWSAFMGPQNPDTNFGSVAFFGLWWSSVMLISLVVLGRVWCYFCPMGAIVRFTQRFGLKRHFPMFTGPNARVFGISLSVISITAITFLFARMPMYKLGVVFSPRLIGYYFLSFTTLTVGVSLVFQRQAFCRYICPATGVMSVTSKLSPFEIRQESETGVPCATLEYQSEYLSTDRRCVSCMKCTTQQPDEDVGLRVRWPGIAAVHQRIPLADEALLVIILWAVFPVDHVLGDHAAALVPLGEPWSDVIAYSVSVGAAIGAYLGANALGTWWSSVDWEASFTRFAYAYLPFSIMYMLGNHVIPGLMEEGGALLNVFFRGIGVPLALPEALASPSTIATWEWVSVTIWPLIAILWGVAIVWYSAKFLTKSDQQAIKAIAPHVVLLVVSTAWIIGLFGPLH
ncbi:4Fe-4S binding protein (plasmid) [Halorarum halophilum]|uniref:4Fe-4S binding protein n=1 Tax=Halorarum halophilum TaxID=2743090 RepID=A0A7D5KAF2_9EURY|nr:4Fe-4S binding protein [Halobaculum halophilum]QLG29819.1 4Fe-4S binding protein [Halobaculum halophilum]